MAKKHSELNNTEKMSVAKNVRSGYQKNLYTQELTLKAQMSYGENPNAIESTKTRIDGLKKAIIAMDEEVVALEALEVTEKSEV